MPCRRASIGLRLKRGVDGFAFKFAERLKFQKFERWLSENKRRLQKCFLTLMIFALQNLEMRLARNATRLSILSICFCLTIPALLKADEAAQVEETSLSDLYANYKRSLVKEDFEERPGVVSAIRCYYRLCGVHQMVTVFASASKDNPSVLSYSVEVVSTNVPGMKETQIIVNTMALKSGEPKELLDHINASGVFGKPKLIETKGAGSSFLRSDGQETASRIAWLSGISMRAGISMT